MAKAKQTATKQAKPSKVASNSKTIKKAEKAVKWTHSKVKDNDYFSEHQYFKVISIVDNAVFLQNSEGKTLGIE